MTLESISVVEIASQASAMPAPTWNRLHSNDVDITVDAGFDIVSSIEVVLDGVKAGEQGLFNNKLAELQAKLDAQPKPEDNRAIVRAAQGADALTDLDIPALSTYQRRAALQEVSANVADDFETGMGSETHAWLTQNASSSGEVLSLSVPDNTTASATLYINGVDGALNANAIDVVVGSHASLDLTLSFDSASGCGVIGSTLRLFAGVEARVKITSVQTTSDAWMVFDDSGYVLDDGAKVEVVHRVLGAHKAYTGLAADLRGESSQLETYTRYIGADTSERDFNYIVRHRGKNTISNLNANGVLAGESKKTLRGTIDLIHGCKGAEGNERETVLLADDRVENRTVPVILCDEDDVAGNHGATIGHVRPEQLFYLTCRGLAEDQVESLFFTSALEEAALTQSDSRIINGIERLAQELGTPLSLGEY